MHGMRVEHIEDTTREVGAVAIEHVVLRDVLTVVEAGDELFVLLAGGVDLIDVDAAIKGLADQFCPFSGRNAAVGGIGSMRCR